MSDQSLPEIHRNADDLPTRIHDLNKENLALKKKLAAGRLAANRYISMLDQQHAAIHVVDENLRMVFFNGFFQEWYRKLGIEFSESSLHQTLFKLFPFLEKKVESEYREVFQTGQKHISEDSLRIGGEELIVQTQKLPVFDGERVCEVITIIRDVTGAHRSEEELHASEERFRLIFEFAPDAYYLSDPKGMFLEGNRAAEELIGYSRDELIGRNYLTTRLLQARQLPRAAKLLADSAAGRPVGPRELTLLRKDGTPITVEIRTFPVRINGRTQILSIARDNSEKKINAARQTRFIRDLQHLSSSAMRFVELSRDDNIYRIIGEGLSHFIGRGYSVITSYSAEENSAFVEYLGVGERQVSKLIKLIGLNPQKMKFTLDNPEARERVYRGRLNRVEGGVHEVSFRKIPKSISALVEKTFGIKSIYSVGFLNRGVLYGAAVLFLKQSKLENRELVETYVNQAAVALQKWHAERRIAESLKEKEVLLREIHHRVKNNMQIISSLLRLQERSISDPALREPLRISQNRIRSMALVHEGLYRSNDLSHIDFSHYIRSLTTHLFSLHRIEPGKVDMQVTVGDIRLDITRAVPCGLLVNELVTNALKHAFPDHRSGRIQVSMEQGKNQSLLLTVADDGVGFPSDLDFRKTESLGMQLVNDLTRQLDGKVRLIRDNGSEFRITF
jgi:PAS domain S-box-containing protein